MSADQTPLRRRVKDKKAGFKATERIEAPQGGPGRGPWAAAWSGRRR